MGVKNKCALLLLILLNLVVFIAGGTAVIAGCLVKFGSGFLDTEVTTLFNKITVNNVPLGTLADVVAYMMIISGALLMIIAILGICGAWKEVTGCLWAYIVVIIILMLVQITMVALWIFMRQVADEWFQGKMLTLLESYEGPSASDDTSKGWNTLFMNSECCGVNGQYASGGTKNDFQEVPANWWASRGSDNIPATCCKGVTSSTISSYVGSATCTTTTPPTNFYETGCYDRIVDIVNRQSLVIFIVVGVIFFIEVTGVVCACMLAKKKSSKVESSPRNTQFDQVRLPGQKRKPMKY